MDTKRVGEILVRLADYPNIPLDSTVSEAFARLRQAHAATGWRFRNLLVLDGDGRLAGLIGMRDLLRAMMPEYLWPEVSNPNPEALGDPAPLCLAWAETFDAHCRQTSHLSLAKFMRPVHDTVSADAPATVAAYLMMIHRADMLPVVTDEQVVGVVRIVDIFDLAAAKVIDG